MPRHFINERGFDLMRFTGLCLAILLVAAGCEKKPAPVSGKPSAQKQAPVKKEAAKPAVSDFTLGKPNMVLIIIDTLRADHVGKHKDQESVTPVLDGLAAQGVCFTKAYSNAPWTLPAHASLFTGLEPHVHEQTHAAVYDTENGPAVKKEVLLPGRLKTLAEVLKEGGYQTLGISQNPWVGRLSTQNTGFEHYWELWSDAQPLPFAPRQGEELNRHKVTHAFKHYLDTMRDSEKPFFLFINYITCHLPYAPDWKFRRKMVKGFPPDDLFDLNSHNWLERMAEGKLDAERIDYLRKLYRAEAAEADDSVGQIVQLLEDAGAFDDTLFIVTADHGESIGHHELFDHQFSIFDDLVKIPLVMRHPRLPQGKEMAMPVQLTDLMPTLLQMSGLGKAREGLDLPGWVIPLDPAYQGDVFADRPLFFFYEKGARVLRLLKDKLPAALYERHNCALCGVQQGPWKLIVTGHGKVMLFNTGDDAEEGRDLAKEKADVAAGLLDAVKKHFADTGFPFSNIK